MNYGMWSSISELLNFPNENTNNFLILSFKPHCRKSSMIYSIVKFTEGFTVI